MSRNSMYFNRCTFKTIQDKLKSLKIKNVVFKEYNKNFFTKIHKYATTKWMKEKAKKN